MPRGIEQISYTQVDNPIVKVIDPHGNEALGVGFLVFEFERVGRHQVRVPLLEGPIVQEPLHAVSRAEVHVVPALRADAHQPFGLLSVDRLAAFFAADEQSARHASLFAHYGSLRSGSVGFGGGHGRR